jgi:hypothetical protein
MPRNGKEVEGGSSDALRAVDATMAVFLDLENIALGAKTALFPPFNIKLVLERLLLRGHIVVRRPIATIATRSLRKTFMKPHSSSSKFLTLGIRARIPPTSGWWSTPWIFATRNSIWILL